MHIEFLTTHKVKQGDGKGPAYEAGKTYAFEGPVAETYARKYVARGLAKEAPVSSAKPSAGGSGRGGRRGSTGNNAPEPPEAPSIRQEMVGDERKLYVVKPWPKLTRIAEEMLTEKDAAIEVSDDQVKITVANGFAVYKIGADAVPGYRDCELVDSAFEPVPEAK